MHTQTPFLLQAVSYIDLYFIQILTLYSKGRLLLVYLAHEEI